MQNFVQGEFAGPQQPEVSVSERSPSPLERRALRDALGHFATGVTVITARAADGRKVGLTVNSFSSLSLDPALILWSIASTSPNRDVFENGAKFTVNVLRAEDAHIATHFATPLSEKFSGVAHGQSDGVPELDNALVRLGCRVEQTHAAGDHLLIIGAVDRLDVQSGLPLVFFRGAFHGVGG
ncbi:hypothetical protein SAMN05446635_6761 [Burkholderia sp. OK233]|nr:hypothetical protein SAMN05446635_6761 [Burkholderia sp. OK233]